MGYHTSKEEHEQKFSMLQYENLRTRFNDMLNKTLGADYYNYGMDVYKCDEISCDHIVGEVKFLKDDVKLWKCIAIFLVIVTIVSFFFKSLTSSVIFSILQVVKC